MAHKHDNGPAIDLTRHPAALQIEGVDPSEAVSCELLDADGNQITAQCTAGSGPDAVRCDYLQSSGLPPQEVAVRVKSGAKIRIDEVDEEAPDPEMCSELPLVYRYRCGSSYTARSSSMCAVSQVQGGRCEL